MSPDCKLDTSIELKAPGPACTWTPGRPGKSEEVREPKKKAEGQQASKTDSRKKEEVR